MRSSASFREAFAGEVGRGSRVAAAPVIAVTGVVAEEGSGRRASKVRVFGVDDRFWTLHGRPITGPPGREALISRALADELGAAPASTLLVTVRRAGAIPASSLFGRRDDLARTLRVSVAAVLGPEDAGEFALEAQQQAARTIFVPLALLQRTIEEAGRVDTVLLGEGAPAEGVAAQVRAAAALDDIGVRVRVVGQGSSLSVESETGLVDERLAAAAVAEASPRGWPATGVLAYLANRLRFGAREVPYSVVAAVDDGVLAEWGVAPAREGAVPIVLNDWTARQLRASVGDPLQLEYYLWREEGRLETGTADFTIAAIVPMTGLAADPDLVPEYPGITTALHLADWDPPFPLDLGRVRPVDEDALPPSLRDEAAAHAARVAGTQGATVLVIRSPCAREGAALAGIVAERLGLAAVDMGKEAPSAHSCWLAATESLPVLRHALGPGDQCRLEPAGDHRGPIIVLAGSEGVIEAPMPVSEWRVAIPDETERALLWQAGGIDAATAADAAQTYRQGAGRIAEIVEKVAVAAPADDDPWSRLTEAVESGASQLDMLARRSSARVEREDLVVPKALGEGLDLLVDRIRLRNRLADDLGPSLRARYRPGVRALFTGESGTGKTLAAHWMARRTGLPLYRVDLAAMTSKWIGETEKNLSAVLDAAQHADVVLFFDEADSLFGARTDVSDAHDRYANAQTNFLLQRIEDFDGVAILATNSRDRFDPAFVRRLDAILDFPLPDAAARRALWRTHFGDGHKLTDRQIDALSVAVDLAGGHIRNMVLNAAIRARRDDRPIAFADIAAAVAEEYGKLGRSPPDLREC